MGKKPAGNSAANGSFGRIEVDPGIADKLDHAAKIARALKDNKLCNRERIRDKKSKRARSKWSHIEHGHKLSSPMTESQLYTMLNNAARDDILHDNHFKVSRREMIPSNHNKRDQGYSGWSSEWHRQAHTGMTGKPPKHRDHNDPIHSKYPFAPKPR